MGLYSEDEWHDEISALRRETGDAQQTGAESTTFLEFRLSAALERETIEIEKTADLVAELSLVKHLLNNEHGGRKWP